MLKKTLLAAAAATSTFVALPAAAEARHQERYSNGGYEQQYRSQRYYGQNRYYQNNRRYKRCKGTTGLIAGGAGGALLGREIAGRGSRTTGTIIGAAVGALAGRAIDKNICRN
jgi:outer membrane lipoprotein SlyB